jgi:OmcA/MtrC family decaheme c-type cytochrome
MASYRHSFIRFVSLFVLAVSFAACSGGDDGRDGQDGAPGAGGPPGNPGPEGPSGGTALPIDSADRINITVSAVDIPAGGGAPTVTLSLTNDLGLGLKDLPAGDIRFVLSQLTPGSAGGSSEWQSYVTRANGGVPDVQATTETATAGTFTDNGDGTYEYTFANDLGDYPAGPVFDAAKTHRLGIEIRNQAPISTNGIYDFVPAGGMPIFERKIVDNDTCNACHDRLEFHGGPRTDVEYCVMCHNPYSRDGNTDNSVDMKVLIHNIHVGRDGYIITGYRDTYDYSEIRWTQDPRNCQTCHEEDDTNTPQASNWRLVQNRAACGTCHYDDGDPDNGIHDYAIEDGIHPFGQNFQDDTQCALCHGPGSALPFVQIANAHVIPVQEASKRFEFNIVDVFDMGVGLNPTVHISVTDPTNGDAPYDILNDTEFTTCTFGESRLAISIGWDTADYRNTGSGANPAQPISMNPLTCFGNTGATPVAGSPGVFAVISGTAIPDNAAGTTAAVTIDGHPAVDVDGNGSFERIPVLNVIEYVGVDGADVSERRQVVDIEKCDDCHKQLSLHGNNRTDNPQVCVVCHNPNATDARQRVPVDPADLEDPPVDCINVLGDDDAPIDFKFMVHAIHASGETNVNYEACGYNNSVHVYDVKYPGHLNNCEGCHINNDDVSDTFYPVAPGTTLGTTVDVGDDVTTPIDDTVISPNAAVCSTCHVSELAKQHMIQNGGDFEATKAADSSLISSGVETCELCHGKGRTADVKEMHGVDEFQFN